MTTNFIKYEINDKMEVRVKCAKLRDSAIE